MSRVIGSSDNAVTQSGQPIGIGTGAEPPPGAPHEVSAGVDDAARTVPADRRGNEQELTPLKPSRNPPLSGKRLVAAVGEAKARIIEAGRALTGGARPSVATAVVETVAMPKPMPAAVPVQAAPAAVVVGPVMQTPVDVEVPVDVQPDGTIVALDTDSPGDVADAADLAEVFDIGDQPPLGPVLPHMRAASDTDSPSRGIPTPIVDPGKRVTGGFGDMGEAQYFPLDGAELRTLIEKLLDDIRARIRDDGRFTIALTYPRVTARVDVTIEGVASDSGFTIPKVLAPRPTGQPGTTPIDIARTLGEEIVFVVTAQRQEFDAAGQSISPPNAMREELQLGIPSKRRIDVPGGHLIVDVVTR